MTPAPARARLQAHAKWLRDEIDRRKIELSATSAADADGTIYTVKAESLPEIEHLECAATAIEQFLSSGTKSPDARRKDKERMALARKVFRLERRGRLASPSRLGQRLSWDNIQKNLSALGEIEDKI